MVFKKESFGLDVPAPKLWDMNELSYDSDDSNEELEPLHPEDWQDWHSEELLEAWSKVREYIDSKYIRINVKYPDFVECIINPPHGDDIHPTRTEQDLWNTVSRLPIIQERLSDKQFFTWIRQNIDRHCNV
jgi:hypothetical protein